MIICAKCQAANRDDAQFCKQCGHSLQKNIGAVADSPDVVTCKNCGHILRLGSRFCSHCGFSLDHQTSGLGSKLMRCSHCGALIRNSSRFCKNCGCIVKDIAIVSNSLVDFNKHCSFCNMTLRPGAHFCPACGSPVIGQIRFEDSTSRDVPYSVDERLPLELIFQRYLIIEKIAKGGMSIIYRARDQGSEGPLVALKEVIEESIAVEERQKVLDAFEREAALLIKLNHPNLVRGLNYFQERGRRYLVMEFIEGRTLDSMLAVRSVPFSETEVLHWAEQLCSVLDYLHSQDPPIIYRDIKPSNIMIMESLNRIKLVDFGIARFFKPGKRQDTIQFGTPGYAPPEQYGTVVNGRKGAVESQTDRRSDIYALGATLHHLLTLRDPCVEPFKFPPVRSLNSEVSRRVEIALLCALELAREKRYRSIVEMWQALSGKEMLQLGIKGKRSYPEPAPDALISFGQVREGLYPSILNQTISLCLSGKVIVKTVDPWIQAKFDLVDEDFGELEVAVDTSSLKPGFLHQSGGNFLQRWVGWHTAKLIPSEQEHRTPVFLEQENGVSVRYWVSVWIVPLPWKVSIGSIMALMVIAGEFGFFLNILINLFR